MLGDDVLDSTTETKRDVDVTVRVQGEGGDTFAFKAYEVKKEAHPLDVAVVEQLAQKMKDMDSISHRAIVSTSGFTEPARRKAKAHGVTLYELKPWTRPVKEQFPSHFDSHENADQMFRMRRVYLTWQSFHFQVTGPEMPASQSINDADPVFTKAGKPHRKFKRFADFKYEMLLRSTEILCMLNPARAAGHIYPIAEPAEGSIEAGPAWPHTHTLGTTEDAVYLQFPGATSLISSVTISGELAWQKRGERQLSYVMENVETGDAFAGAIILPEDREGGMKAFVFSPTSREVGIRFVQLTDKQLNMLRKLPLK